MHVDPEQSIERGFFFAIGAMLAVVVWQIVRAFLVLVLGLALMGICIWLSLQIMPQ